MKTPRVLLSSTSDDFDPVVVRRWREEGFAISYLPFNGNPKDYVSDLKSVADRLDFGEKFVLIGTEFSCRTQTWRYLMIQGAELM